MDDLFLDNKKKKEQQQADLLEATIGNIGRWQFKISLFMSLLKLPIAWFQLGIVFLAPRTEFWCKPSLKYSGMEVEDWKEFIAPKDNLTPHYSAIATGSCLMRDIESDAKNGLISCRWGYDYNTSVIRSSIITEWDLVCSRERLVDVSQITLMFGVLVGSYGSIVFGLAADKFGRKHILLFSIIAQSMFGILSALSPWLTMFMITRFFLAMANGGTMITSFVMCMEIVGGKWRAIIPILYQIPFGIGNTVMAGIAYFIRDWRELQLALSGLSSIYFTYIYLVPESPRWLIAVGREAEAISILEEAAVANGLKKDDIAATVKEFSAIKVDTTDKPGLLELVKTNQIRKRTTLLCFNWFICGVSFFGFTQYLGQLSDNIYFAVSVGGLIAVPGTLLCVLVVHRVGRRVSIASASSFTALCFILIIMVPRGSEHENLLKISLAGCGVIGISVSVPALYLFTGELYPTTLRNAGVGTAVMCSKLGSMLAPLVIALGAFGWYLPLLILGVLSTLEAMLVLPLPETSNKKLPETIMDVERCACPPQPPTNNSADTCECPKELIKPERKSLLTK